MQAVARSDPVLQLQNQPNYCSGSHGENRSARFIERSEPSVPRTARQVCVHKFAGAIQSLSRYSEYRHRRRLQYMRRCISPPPFKYPQSWGQARNQKSKFNLFSFFLSFQVIDGKFQALKPIKVLDSCSSLLFFCVKWWLLG